MDSTEILGITCAVMFLAIILGTILLVGYDLMVIGGML